MRKTQQKAQKDGHLSFGDNLLDNRLALDNLLGELDNLLALLFFALQETSPTARLRTRGARVQRTARLQEKAALERIQRSLMNSVVTRLKFKVATAKVIAGLVKAQFNSTRTFPTFPFAFRRQE